MCIRDRSLEVHHRRALAQPPPLRCDAPATIANLVRAAESVTRFSSKGGVSACRLTPPASPALSCSPLASTNEDDWAASGAWVDAGCGRRRRQQRHAVLSQCLLLLRRAPTRSPLGCSVPAAGAPGAG